MKKITTFIMLAILLLALAVFLLKPLVVSPGLSPAASSPGVGSVHEENPEIQPSPSINKNPPTGTSYSIPAPPSPPPGAPFSIPSQSDAFARPGLDGLFPGDMVWPAYLPADIPPIPAPIWLVQADQYTVRIWFKSMPQSDFYAYLSLLKSQGFTLEYLIYQQPGVVLTDADKIRILAEGKFDAVRIKKERYDFFIEYGANEGTYDLNTGDFLIPGATTSAAVERLPERRPLFYGTSGLLLFSTSVLLF